MGRGRAGHVGIICKPLKEVFAFPMGNRKPWKSFKHWNYHKVRRPSSFFNKTKPARLAREREHSYCERSDESL